MFKIAISGKANSGKNTLSDLIIKNVKSVHNIDNVKSAALADPIKEIIKIMFPETDEDILYGPSKNRLTEVPGIIFNGEPLTYRKLLQHLGTDVGRGYSDTIWLNVIKYKIDQAEKDNVGLFINQDVRFINEYMFFKNMGFKMIRIKRDNQFNMNHDSEKEQESIFDYEFDYVINNNGNLKDLNNCAKHIVTSL